jgi:hypothetical protein
MAVGEKSQLLSDALIRESLLRDETGGKSRHSSVLVGDARSASVCFGYTQGVRSTAIISHVVHRRTSPNSLGTNDRRHDQVLLV